MGFQRRLVGAFVAMLVVILTAGCGASGPESSVNGCAIQAGTSCPGADLSGADLASADLSQADLSDTNLEGTNLSGANLTEANLRGAQLVDADLSDADLTRANLTGATITGTTLNGATLCGTTRTDGTIDDTSCPASTETTETTDTAETTETTETTEAEVTSFVVGAFACQPDASQGTVTVSWTTKATTAVELGVDGQTASDAGPSGTKQLEVPCDGETHKVSVTAVNDAGPGETETKEISPG